MKIDLIELSDKDIYQILVSSDKKLLKSLQEYASEITVKYYGKDIYIRGLIEFTNYCKEDCYYCGIRNSNNKVKRYKLSEDQVLETIDNAYNNGFRTFVLQGGEESVSTSTYFINIIEKTKKKYPNTRITLSIGKRDFEDLKAFKEAGADRFLLRHETANPDHFNKLHPGDQKLEDRIIKLRELKDLGYVIGSGFMIGSPYQTIEDIIMDFNLLKELQAEMIGVGPFIPHKDTKFKDFKAGDLTLSLKIISLLRIIFPKALIPATTALNTLNENARMLGIVHGANVIMPNISPNLAKENYQLYNNKANSYLESGEYLDELNYQLKKIDRKIVIGPGDPIKEGKNEIR